ncbi:hypothetical protein PDA01_18110 [Pediococcus damnosus]|nr:hypothetical protein PDA01_18110 [Pediococcus damnosus]
MAIFNILNGFHFISGIFLIKALIKADESPSPIKIKPIPTAIAIALEFIRLAIINTELTIISDPKKSTNVLVNKF